MICDRRSLTALGAFLVTFAIAHGSAPAARAQDPAAKPRDEALDSLLEDLKKNDPAPAAKTDAARTDGAKSEASNHGGKAAPKPAATDKDGGKPRPASSKPATEAVSGKDKEIDDLLEKLGETNDQPAPEERRPGGAGADEPDRPGSPAGGSGPSKDDRRKSGAGGLDGKDKELDERLEEFAGIRRKKKREGAQDGNGPTSQIIKQMREVEQRLGKPETGGDTQAKQKEIVKKIETLIEQVRQSSSSGSKTIRMVRQQGQKPGGQEPGQEPGTNPGGAPLQKPGKPSDRHALAGGKEIWGHLPPELRQEMENVFKEEALSTSADMIKRYYLSVAKRKLVRGD
jgi:hypothetical protein